MVMVCDLPINGYPSHIADWIGRILSVVVLVHGLFMTPFSDSVKSLSQYLMPLAFFTVAIAELLLTADGY